MLQKPIPTLLSMSLPFVSIEFCLETNLSIRIWQLFNANWCLKQPNLLLVYYEDWQHPLVTQRCAASFRTPVFFPLLWSSFAQVLLLQKHQSQGNPMTVLHDRAQKKLTKQVSSHVWPRGPWPRGPANTWNKLLRHHRQVPKHLNSWTGKSIAQRDCFVRDRIVWWRAKAWKWSRSRSIRCIK